MKYYFPIHLNGGNRGCEGIAKGTSLILNKEPSNLIGLCTDVNLDKRLAIDKYIQLQAAKYPSLPSRLFWFHFYRHLVNQSKWSDFVYHYFYDDFLNQIQPDDIMLSTGGDMLCYEENQVIYTNNLLHSRGIKTGLWGCSMGPENLTKKKEESLRNFSFLYARESLTYDFFKDLGLNNVFCSPDPAFVLQPEEVNLPDVFSNNEVIGLNISNYVLGDYELEKEFGQQVKKLIDFLLAETNLHICLIPHVLWRDQDDRIVANKIRALYSNTERFSVLDSDAMNYCQIRYVISKCKYFIGARTHAVISAYSTCVPTIALGYSIKSKGIAKDIGIPQELVVNSKQPLSHDSLLQAFMYLLDNEKSVRNHMQVVMPEYCKKPYQALEIIKNIIS